MRKLIVLLLITLLASCSKDDYLDPRLIGTWNIDKISLYGELTINECRAKTQIRIDESGNAEWDSPTTYQGECSVHTYHYTFKSEGNKIVVRDNSDLSEKTGRFISGTRIEITNVFSFTDETVPPIITIYEFVKEQ